MKGARLVNTWITPSVSFEPSPELARKALQVLVLTNMYPHSKRPGLGVFVRQQVESLRTKGVADAEDSERNTLDINTDMHRQIPMT